MVMLTAVPSQEAIMSILLWYLPYAMFSGACDVVLAENGTRMSSERRADSAKRKRDTVAIMQPARGWVS